MGQRLGTVTMRLVHVAWDRQKLPSHGELWGTTTGLLYWPLLKQQPNGSIVPPDTLPSSASSSWSLFARWRAMDVSPRVDTPGETWTPLPEGGTSLGQCFLDAPGAAFFPREQVVKITCRHRTWSLHRTIGRPLRFTLPSQSVNEVPSWKAFFQQDSWRRIAAVS